MSAKTLTFAFALALSSFATSCGAALFDREVTISEAEIQQELIKAGPQARNFGGLITVSLLEPPAITLGTPSAGQVGISARIDLTLLGNRPVPVTFTGTAGVRYDEHRKAFFLDKPVAQSVESPALPPEAKPAARQAVNTLIAGYFRSQPVYVLRENGSAQEIAARWLLRSIRIEVGKVVATLSPL